MTPALWIILTLGSLRKQPTFNKRVHALKEASEGPVKFCSLFGVFSFMRRENVFSLPVRFAALVLVCGFGFYFQTF